jgi:hypothetical protein
MKTKSKIEKLLIIALINLCLMTVSIASIAQKKISAKLKEFKIKIEKTDNGLKMHSDKGCAWTDLSFSLSNNQSQVIDEYGMTQLGKVATNKDPKLADFLFTITKTKEGITLTSIEGTAWKELSFTLKKNSSQTIDQLGMTK